MNKRIISQYLSAGKKLMPLKHDIPPEKWTSENFNVDDKKLYNHNGNIGWIIGKSDIIIDVDPRNGGDESYEKFLKRFPGLNLKPIVSTPRGGFHIYLSIPKDQQNFKFRKKLKKEFPGIDFLTKGCYCVISGCENEYGKYRWYDDIFGEFEQNPISRDIIDLIKYEPLNDNDNDNDSFGDIGDFEGLISNGSSNWPENKVLDMLSKLDPSMSNDEWVKIGMALHDWDTIRGLDLWEKWSKDGDNYQDGETEKRWRSFDLNGGVTLGTVSYMVKEVDFDEKSLEVIVHINNIKRASEKSLEFDIVPKLKKTQFNKINKEKLVKAIQDRYKEMSGIRIPISGVRQSISNDNTVNGKFISDDEQPPWCKDWIYVNSHGGFINLKTLKLYKSESFNNKNGKFVPSLNDSGTKTSATKYVADKGFVDQVETMAYLPTCSDVICEIDGSRILNSFNPASVPVEAEIFTSEGIDAIRMVKKHIKFICGNNENAGILTQWLAHQIQHPGVKILWAPVIQSIQGVGKSFFAELLRICLGDVNVGTVSPTQITSDFNGWATNTVVNILEELRVKGRNRHEAVNALKPLITDRMIQINIKGVSPYLTYNTANYMCFTNDKDAIPMNMDDRRWWVIFVSISSLEDMKEIVGENTETYFPKLFNAVRTFGDEIRKWFLEYNITKEFLNMKQAPMTDYKLSMIAAEEAAFEGLCETKQLIKEGHKYYNSQCISSPDLFDQLMFKYPEIEINTSRRHIILKKLGYMPIPSLVKVNGKPRRIWTKIPMSNNNIRLSFEKKALIKNNL